MNQTTSLEASRLIQVLRKEAGLTQGELARRVGTTQSVISRLESDEYEGHSLSMLYRIGVALDRRIFVDVARGDAAGLSVREGVPSYHAAAAADAPADAPETRLTPGEFERLAERLTQRFIDNGVTRSDVEEAIRWALSDPGLRSLDALRGAIKVGPGDVVGDVRRARAERGRDRVARP